MKKSLPANAKISKEAKETVQECVSEFISFITGEASDKCQREKRKTINGDDLLWAMTTLGFENYVGTLKIYLNKYRETEGEKTIMASSTSPTNNSNVSTEISKVANYSTNTSIRPDNFNVYYSTGEQVQTKSYGDQNMMNIAGGTFGIGKIRDIGDGNGNRIMASTHHLHHGVEW